MIGTSENKIDGMGSMLGKPLYVQDLAPTGCLCVKLLRSPHAYAEIEDIRADKALALPGVVCVFSHRDVKPILHTYAAEAYPEGSPYDRCLFNKTVRYVGDPVALVAAKDERTAIEALELIEVDYRVLEPILDFERALDNPTILHRKEEVFANLPIDNDPERNIAAAFPWKRGDVEAEFALCDEVAEGSYYTTAQAHATLETHRAFCQIDPRGKLVICSSCQSPFHVQRIVSKVLELPQNRIRVVKPKVGGAFGGKNSTFVEAFVALVTLRTGKPCMLVFTREEAFACSNTRHAIRVTVKMGACRSDGIIRAIRLEVLSNTGAYGEHAIDVLAVACKNVLPIYGKVKAVEYSGTAVYTNLVPAGAFRGFGAPQANFGIESTVHRLALALGWDPVEFRLRNIIAVGESHPFLAGANASGDAKIGSSALERCIRRGRDLIGWKEKFPRIEGGAARGGDKVRGVGCAIAMHGSSIGGMDVVEAEVRLNYDSSYTVMTGASDLGTGAETILAQFASQVLMTGLDNIQIVCADTGVAPMDKGAYASSTTYLTGNAVVKACEKLLEQLTSGASLVMRTDREVSFDGKTFRTDDGEKALTLVDYLTKINYYKYAPDYFAAEDIPQLIASARHGGPTAPPPYVAGFAEVEVDKRTGEARVIKYVAIADCGTVINPALARIQLEGGIVQGMGWTLTEDVKYDKSGRMLSDSFMHYKIPTSMDAPLELIADFEQSYEPTGPFGAKSLGEVVVHTPAAAIATAIYDAVGADIRSLPLTSEKILKAITAAEEPC